ncbi:MAG: hypothetical protein ACI9EF_002153 [Pseudohongiellaceae bacterium]
MIPAAARALLSVAGLAAALTSVSFWGLRAAREPLRWAEADRSQTSTSPIVLRDVTWHVPASRQPAGVVVRLHVDALVAERDSWGPFAVGPPRHGDALGWTVSFDDGQRQLQLQASQGVLSEAGVLLRGKVTATDSAGTTWSVQQLRWLFGEGRLAVIAQAKGASIASSTESTNWHELGLWSAPLGD